MTVPHLAQSVERLRRPEVLLLELAVLLLQCLQVSLLPLAHRLQLRHLQAATPPTVSTTASVRCTQPPSVMSLI